MTDYRLAGSTDAPKAASGTRAGFWQRFAAAFIDGLLLGILDVVLTLAVQDAGRVISLLVGIGYFSYLEGTGMGQTLGKRALGIRVVSLDGGGPIGIGRGLIRYFGRWVSTVVILLGYFWMLWDREKQTWHDKFAGSVVVPVDAHSGQY